MIGDSELDTLLGEALAAPPRGPDRLFVARIQASVSEAERFRRWRRRAFHQVGSEALILGAIAGAVLTIARAPLARELFAQVPLAVPAAIGLALLLWIAMAPQRGRVLV